MKYPLVRATPLKSLTDALAKYIVEHSHSANNRPGPRAVMILRKSLPEDELAARLSELLKRSHPSAYAAVEMIFSSPPAYDPPQKIRDESASADELAVWEARVEAELVEKANGRQALEIAWAEDCLTWVEDGAPNAEMVVAALFQDGDKVELRCIFLPVCSNGKLGWTRLQAEIHSGAGVKSPGRTGLADSGTKLQVAFYDAVGKHYDLRCEGVGSQHEHQPLNPTERRRKVDTRSERVAETETQERNALTKDSKHHRRQDRKLRDDFQMLQFAFYWCCFQLSKGHSSLIEAWVAKHLDLRLSDRSIFCEELLSQAVTHSDLGRVQALLELGVNPNIAGPVGITALMRAATAGNKEITAALVAAGADAARLDVDGYDCADYARQAGHYDLAEDLDGLIQIAGEKKTRSE